MGLFDKLKEGLRKTTRLLNTDIRDLFKSTGDWSTRRFSTALRHADQDRHGRAAGQADRGRSAPVPRPRGEKAEVLVT